MARNREYAQSEAEIQLSAAKQHISAMAARIRDMEEQHRSREEHQAAEISRLRHIESSARDLCTQVLSKDRGEMVLGTNYTWGKLDTEELIHRAGKSYKEYCIMRTKDLQKLKDFAMEKNEKLLEIQERMDQMTFELESQSTSQGTREAIEQRLMESEKRTKEAFRNADIRYEDDEEEAVSTIIRKTASSINQELKRESLHKSYEKQQRAIEVRDKERQLRREHAEIDTIDNEVRVLAGTITEEEKVVIATIGKGLSVSSEIRQISGLNSRKFSETIRSLDSKNIIVTVLKVSIPFAGTPNLHMLTSLGKKIHKLVTNEYPAQSEAERIRKVHANYDHGYGIRELAKLLRASKRYEAIDMFAKPMNLGDGITYIPDIVAVYKRNEDGTIPQPDYYEYERVRQIPQEYYAKFNKMARITKEINVVVPSSNDHLAMQKHMFEWAKSHANDPDYRNITMRLTSCTVLHTNIKYEFARWWNIDAYVANFPDPGKA